MRAKEDENYNILPAKLDAQNQLTLDEDLAPDGAPVHMPEELIDHLAKDCSYHLKIDRESCAYLIARHTRDDFSLTYLLTTCLNILRRGCCPGIIKTYE